MGAVKLDSWLEGTYPVRELGDEQRTTGLEPTGVPGLDEVLGGGIPRAASMLVVGSPGSGKTTLAAQIGVTTARAGRQVLILTALSEASNKLIDHLRSYRFFDDQLWAAPCRSSP